jgi:hypothetical protein
MPADLGALLTHVYVLVDDLLPRRRQRGRPVRISDGELICLAIAQVLLDAIACARSTRRRARARTGTDARLRQGLCRAGVRAVRGLVESAHPASRPAQRAGALRLASAASASGSSRPSTRSRTNSRSSATGVGRSVASSAASPVGCWRSPPRSCTTGRSATPDGASSPTTTKESFV